MTRIQVRRDTSTNWISANPILFPGEPAYETDTGKTKIGNGIDNYVTLPYQGDIYLSNIPHIIESYNSTDEYGGYRIYSDGLCLQWGRVATGQSMSEEYPFFTEFKDSKASVITERVFSTGTYHTVVSSITATGFKIGEGQYNAPFKNLSSSARWIAIGYTDIQGD